ncbi:MAG: hypothetical protein LRY55_03555 [Leadbetterella sp.]|nr:hypothetical protein [Leadbetterella sp.]
MRYTVRENDLYTMDTILYVVRDPDMDSLMNTDRRNRTLKPGDPLNHQKVEAEKLRIEQLLKNNGY